MKIARLLILFTVSACGLFAAASSPQAQQPQQTPARPTATPTPQQNDLEEGVTSRVVRVPGTVLDKKGKPVMGLTKNDFLVTEEKRPVQFDFLGEVTELEKLPIYVGVLMDTSSSTSGKLGFEKEGAKNFLYTG